LGRVAKLTGPQVVSYLHKTSPDLPPQLGVLVVLSAEGDEVARTGRDVAQHIAAFAPSYLSRDDVPAETVENERRIAEATAREEGKPEGALPKIVEGRVTGFFKDAVLVDQPFAKENKKSVKQVLEEAGVQVQAFARFRVGQA
jgi:elongation factor Ts